MSEATRGGPGLPHPFRYRPDIDGLRAVAVLAVVLFHAGFGAPGGYVGVDVFFVISGFLITSIVIREIGSGKASLLGFWERRVRRIFPAAFVVSAVTLAAGWFLLLPEAYGELAGSAIAHSFFVANVFFCRKSGYFDGPSEAKPLLHTWSLSVEEQFYLIIPLFLYGLWRRRSWAFVLLLVGALAVSFSHSARTAIGHPAASFFLLPSRAWELILGVLLACYLQRGGRGTLGPLPANLLAAAGLAAIAAAVLLFDDSTLFPGLAAALPCLGAVALIASNADRPTWVGRFLSLPPMVFVGLISYSLYLWHWPLLASLRHLPVENEPAARALAVAGSFALAVLSWRFVETPFRKKALCRGKPAMFSLFAIATAALVVSAGFIHRADGVPDRLSSEVSALTDWRERRPRAETVDAERIREQSLPRIGAPAGEPRFLLWGDSHAEMVSGLVGELASERGVAGWAAVSSGNPPLLETWLYRWRPNLEINRAVFERFEADPVPNVILVARWAAYVHPGEGDSVAKLLVDAEGRPTVASAREVLRRSLAATVARLEGRGATVWIVGQVPYQRYQMPTAIAASYLRGGDGDLGVGRAAHARRQEPFREALRDPALSGVRFVDPAPFLFPAGERSQVVVDGVSVYTDDNHLSEDGLDLIEPALRSILDAIAADRAAPDAP